jgi:DNA-binding HxlR family transcriptional regulator
MKEMSKQEYISCPVHRTMLIIGKRWTALIIRDLVKGKKRFSELEHSLAGISPKILSQRLHELEQCGVVKREIYPEVPPRVEYSLTEKGYDLKNVIDSMSAWGEKWA